MTAAPEMTMTSLILSASPVVQAVMLILVIASVMSWGIIMQRRAVYSRAKTLASKFEERAFCDINLGSSASSGRPANSKNRRHCLSL